MDYYRAKLYGGKLDGAIIELDGSPMYLVIEYDAENSGVEADAFNAVEVPRLPREIAEGSLVYKKRRQYANHTVYYQLMERPAPA